MPRCKYHGTKFISKYFNQKYCLDGEECVAAFVEYAKEQKRKSNRKERKSKLPELYPAKYKGLLQSEINKLARKIDAKLGFTTCIDCGETLIGIGQVDAAHFHNSKNHGNIRYNLHNVHSARSNCNFFSDNHKVGYRAGIIERYSKAYMDRIDSLDLKYKDTKLTNKEIAEKLAIVRKINREFNTYKLTNGVKTRDLFNKLIGIYK